MQMLLAALSRRMSCSRARMVITKARWPSRSVVMPDEPAGDLADERVGAGQDAEVRPAVLRRDPERLALAGGDVGAVRARRREHRQADRLDDRDEQRAGGMGELADLGHRLEQAQEVRLGRDHPGHRVGRRRPAALEGREVGRAGGVALGDQRDLVELEAAAEVRAQRLAVVRVDARETRTRSRRVARQVMRRPRRWPRRRRSARPRRRRARPARRSATRIRRCSAACPG